MRHLTLFITAALLSAPAQATIKVTEKIAVQLPAPTETLSERVSSHHSAAVLPGDSLTAFVYSALIAAQAGRDLTMSECQERLARLDGMLRGMGYGPRRVWYLDDVMYTRWYHSGRDVSVLSGMGAGAVDHDLSVTEYSGKLRWNEFYPIQ